MVFGCVSGWLHFINTLNSRILSLLDALKHLNVMCLVAYIIYDSVALSYQQLLTMGEFRTFRETVIVCFHYSGKSLSNGGPCTKFNGNQKWILFVVMRNS